MNFEEFAAKPLLEAGGIAVPEGRVASSVDEVIAAQAELGAVIIKAQVPTGKRGKAGGIKPADDGTQAAVVAEQLLGMQIGPHRVERVLVERRAEIDSELYAAVLNDAASKGPLMIFSEHGGMDIEEVAAERPDAVRRCRVDITRGFGHEDASALVAPVASAHARAALAEVLVKLYSVYAANDAELVEINPLARLRDGAIVALDCKFVLDDSAINRQQGLAVNGRADPLTALERQGQELGLKYIELDGDIGVLANGAGLTMTTMDVVTHHGGRPANFLEIGGDAYTLATPALELVLANPRVKGLVVNFCGAFARTDVMTEGVVKAWLELDPEIPVFFSVHGTGAQQARAILKEQLDIVPFDTMDDAIIAAIDAARRRSS